MIETRIDAMDFLAQLKGELVLGYTASSQTITTIVTALLAYQAHVTPITLGTISAGIAALTRSIQIDEDELYSALMKLRDTVGGYLYVDNDRQLNWLDDIGENKGQQIRYKKNVMGLSRTYEYTNFGNRLYCYGAGEGTARIKLSDAGGYALDYVEDAASIALNGVCIRRLTDKSITHPDTLYEWALLKLDEMKDPRHSYTVDMINLEAMGWDFEDIQLGSYVKVIDEDLGISINARIVQITRDLTNPENIQVEISNPGKDIIDTLSGLYDKQQFESHIATKIGAGQVVVLGEFMVSDWVTGGTTYIKGDYIRTGVIESTNWGVGAGSQFNLNDGTFKLGGSAAPKLSWDGTTLSVDGVISVGGAADDVNDHATTITGEKITADTIECSKLKASTLTAKTITLGAGGQFVTGAAGSNRIEITSTLIAGYNSMNVAQFYLHAINGKAYCGGGAVILDAEGIWLNSSAKALIFKDTGVEQASIYYSAVTPCLYIETSVLNKHITISAGGYLYLYGYSGIDAHSSPFLDLPQRASAPATSESRAYYNTATHKAYYYNGSTWVEIGTGSGMANPMTEMGSIIYQGVAAPTELLHGTSGQVLTSQGHGAAPIWSNAGGMSSHALDGVTYHSAPSDITTYNSSVSMHGFLKKLDNNADHFMNGQGMWTTPAGAAFATPSITLGLVAGNGGLGTTVRSDCTIAAFDNNWPSTQAFGDSPVIGVASFAARRDHKHGMMAAPTAHGFTQNVYTSPTRQLGVNYGGQAYAMVITVTAYGTAAYSITVYCDASAAPTTVVAATNYPNDWVSTCITFVVPKTYYYRVVVSGTGYISTWTEWVITT